MRAFQKKSLPWLLLSPTLFLLGIFILYPAFYSFYLSSHEVEPFSRQTYYVGWDNYASLWKSAQYWKSLQTSLLFTLFTVVPSLVLSLFLAVALDAQPYVRGLFRTLFVMPVAISSAMAAMLWIFLYNPSAGYLNYMLESIGIPGPNWLGSPRFALIAVSISTIWKEIGFNVIFLLAGLSTVPPELKEAALMDGANPVQRFRHVVLPFLSPTLFFVTVVSVINAFQSFGQIHILTGGGPAHSTNILVYSLFREAFQNFRTGYASAQAVILFLLVMGVTAVQFAIAKKRVHYQ